MSRYETKRDGQRVAYGFDPPLQQYFFQVYGKGGMMIAEENSRGKILGLLETCENIPQKHIECLVLDLPF